MCYKVIEKRINFVCFLYFILFCGKLSLVWMKGFFFLVVIRGIGEGNVSFSSGLVFRLVFWVYYVIYIYGEGCFRR